MPCDTQTLPNQTLTERKTEVKKAVQQLDDLIRRKRVRVRVGPQGAVAFSGWQDSERSRVTDACAFRRIMSTGSALAKAEIAKAELLAGRSIDKQAIAQGHHSHDGGHTWHGKG